MFPFQFYCLQFLTQFSQFVLQGIHPVKLMECIMQSPFCLDAVLQRQVPLFQLQWQGWLIGYEVLLVILVAQSRCDKANTIFFQFLLYVSRGRIVVRHHHYSLPLSDNIGYYVQDRLRLTCTRRALNNANLMFKSIGHRYFLARIAAEWIYQVRVAQFLWLVFCRIEITSGCQVIGNEIYLVIYTRQYPIWMLFVLAQSVDGCHILHIGKHILAHSLLETGLSNNNSASCIILYKTIVVDDPPTGMSIVVKSPYLPDTILQYAVHQHLALCGVFPFWTVEPNHLITSVVIGTSAVFETHAISIAAIPLYGSNLQSLRLSIEQYEVF